MTNDKYLRAAALKSSIEKLKYMLSKRNCLYACSREKGDFSDKHTLYTDDEIDRDIRKILTDRLKEYEAEFANL